MAFAVMEPALAYGRPAFFMLGCACPGLTFFASGSPVRLSLLEL